MAIFNATQYLQCWNHVLIIRNNVATMCSTKSRHCEENI